jgi:uncharacterized protein (TIGR02145 family)
MRKLVMLKCTVFVFICLLASNCTKNDTNENQLPTCQITTPINQSDFNHGDNILIKVEATDVDGQIAEVKLTINGIQADSKSFKPFDFSWIASDATLGDHTIKATARDNDNGEASDEVTVTILGTLAKITTSPVTSIMGSTALGGGTITSDGGESITARGICWSINQNPTTDDNHTNDGTGTGTYSSNLSGLTSSTTYYVRAYATTSIGTAYGNEKIFSSIPPGQVTDIDNNDYTTVTIGTQVWMAENLKTTHYSDGTSIPLVENADDWANLDYEDIAMCYYDYSSTNADTYGALYSWAAATNNEQVCPTGWHLPSDSEWKQLEMYLGMSQADADNTGYSRGTNEGSKLAGNSELWEDGALENDVAFGTSGFLALPDNLGSSVYFWSATEGNSMNAWMRGLTYDGTGVYRNPGGKRYGCPVRCIKD